MNDKMNRLEINKAFGIKETIIFDLNENDRLLTLDMARDNKNAIVITKLREGIFEIELVSIIKDMLRAGLSKLEEITPTTVVVGENKDQDEHSKMSTLL